ncbi:MAG: SAF domain-containing protein [Propionibacteriaceae bacterium]|jgi:Flp pilus assembly protein CpaB|nr:SAF domain-containing protein [Propionibacteriaceae bacterium]
MNRLTTYLRRVMLHRRALAALSAMASVLALCAVLQGAGGSTCRVLVVTTRLEAGVTPTTSQVETRAVPSDLAPDGALTDIDWLADHVTAAAIPSGAILTEDDFIGQSQTSPGAVVIPLSVSPQILAAIQPGSRISVFFTDLSTGQATVARGIRVVTTPTNTGSGPFSTGGSTQSILVEVPEATAGQINAAASVGSVSVAIE